MILFLCVKFKFESWTNTAISFTDCTDTLPMQSIRFQLNSNVWFHHREEDFGLKFVFRGNHVFQSKSSPKYLRLDPVDEYKEYNYAVTDISYCRRMYFMCLNWQGIQGACLVLIMFLYLFAAIVIKIYICLHKD